MSLIASQFGNDMDDCVADVRRFLLNRSKVETVVTVRFRVPGSLNGKRPATYGSPGQRARGGSTDTNASSM